MHALNPCMHKTPTHGQSHAAAKHTGNVDAYVEN